MKNFKEFRHELVERKLTKGEKVSKESYVKKLKKHGKDFKDRYREKDGKSIIYALATKYAKKKSEKKLKEDYEVSKKMDRLNYEVRPIFSGTERLPTKLHKQNWISENLPNVNSEELWISDKANGGIGWKQPTSDNTSSDIFSRYQRAQDRN